MKKNKIAAVYSLSVTVKDIDYIYIGSSENIYRRMQENNTKLKNGVHHCDIIQDLYNKGYKHRIELLETAKSYDKLIDSENQYIDFFRRLDGVVVTNVRPAVKVGPRQYLNVYKVVQIKKLIEQGYTNTDISKMLNVKAANISRIRTGNRWSSVKILERG